MNEFAKLLRETREKLGFKHAKKFFNYANLPFTYNFYRLIELGKNKPKIEDIPILAEKLNLPINQLLYAYLKDLLPSKVHEQIKFCLLNSKKQEVFNNIQNNNSDRNCNLINLAAKYKMAYSKTLNLKQINYFKNNITAFELFIYITLNFEEFKLEDLIKKINNLTKDEILTILEDLAKIGVLIKNQDKSYKLKSSLINFAVTHSNIKTLVDIYYFFIKKSANLQKDDFIYINFNKLSPKAILQLKKELQLICNKFTIADEIEEKDEQNNHIYSLFITFKKLEI